MTCDHSDFGINESTRDKDSVVYLIYHYLWSLILILIIPKEHTLHLGSCDKHPATAGTMCNDKNLIGKSGEYMTKMFLFSVFNLIKKDKVVSEEKIYRYTSNRSQTCNIKVTKIM